MTWCSRDFRIDADGQIIDLGDSEFSDKTVDEWRTEFTPDSNHLWYVVHDEPNLVVMFTRTSEEPSPNNYLRISINHRIA